MQDNKSIKLERFSLITGAIPFNERPQSSKLLKQIEAEEIKELHVNAIDRLGRNSFDIACTLEKLKSVGCPLEVHSLGLKMLIDGKSNPAFDMVAAVLGQVSQMERESIKEKQAEGIAIAKANSVYKRRMTRRKVDREKRLQQHSDIFELLKDGKSIRRTAELTKKGISTVQRVKKLMAD